MDIRRLHIVNTSLSGLVGALDHPPLPPPALALIWLLEQDCARPAVCTDPTHLWHPLSQPAALRNNSWWGFHHPLPGQGSICLQEPKLGILHMPPSLMQGPPAQRPQSILGTLLRFHQGRFILSSEAVGVKKSVWTCGEWGQLITQFCPFLRET